MSNLKSKAIKAVIIGVLFVLTVAIRGEFMESTGKPLYGTLIVFLIISKLIWSYGDDEPSSSVKDNNRKSDEKDINHESNGDV